MLRSGLEIDTTTQLFDQLSLSVDNRYLNHRHIAANKPKLKRLLKSPKSSTAYCSRCKKETDPDYLQTLKDGRGHRITENLLQKKVYFLDVSDSENEKDVRNVKSVQEFELEENRKEIPIINLPSNYCQQHPVSESVPVHLQSVFFAQKPSIIGNNEFWLPQYSSSINDTKVDSVPHCATNEETPLSEERTGYRYDEQSMSESEQCSTILGVMNQFFDNIFQKSTKILKVASMVDETLATLTQEYFFKCQRDGNTFKIIEAIALKDVRKVMVNDACSLLVLEVSYAQTLTEFKEFVPGYSEKTESLVSLMVYALSRINNYLPDVTRLPLLSLPTCKAMQSWFVEQNERIVYSGIALAENIFDPGTLAGECFMMRTAGESQFHPVLLLLSIGSVATICKGGCSKNDCKYSMTLHLNEITVVSREDNPWPCCVRLINDSLDVTLASSSTETAEDLIEKLYFCTQRTSQSSIKSYVHIFLSEYSLQMFKITLEKDNVFGSPLLNLDISNEDGIESTCIINSQGVEVTSAESLQTQHCWRLTFLNQEDKHMFLNSVEQLIQIS